MGFRGAYGVGVRRVLSVHLFVSSGIRELGRPLVD